MTDEDKLMILLAEADNLLWNLWTPEAAEDVNLEAKYTRIRLEIREALYAYRQRKGVH